MSLQNAINQVPGFPTSHLHIWGHGRPPAGKTFTRTNNTSAELGFYYTLNNQSVGDVVEYEVLLMSGAYTMTLYGQAGTNRCVAAIYIDNGLVGFINYNAASTNLRKVDTVNFTLLTNGLHSIKIMNAGGNSVALDNTLSLSAIRIDPQVSTAANAYAPILINCGKNTSNYNDGSKIWTPNFFYAGGGSLYNASDLGVTSTTIQNTIRQELYKSEASIDSGSLSYILPCPAGTYNLELGFCENFRTAAGQRVGSVSLNGSLILSNFDIFAEAGGKNKALLKVFSGLNLSACAVTISNTLINAIELIKI